MVNILIVSDSLSLHGAAKSLVNMLSYIDYKKYNVDLFLLHGFDNQLDCPEKVNLLPTSHVIESFALPWKKSIVELARYKNIKAIFYRLYSKFLPLGKSRTVKLQLMWPHIIKMEPTIQKQYDIAISFQDYFTSEFILQNVRATTKVTWNHNPVSKMGLDLSIYKKCLSRLDKVVTVSKLAYDDLLLNLGDAIANKAIVFNNTQNINEILKKSRFSINTFGEFQGLKLLTIGRLTQQKNYPFVIDIAKQLKEKNISFLWLILGEGELREQIEAQIIAGGLSNNIILVGATANPYPFIYNCDFYIQPSEFEADPMAVKEAMILKKLIFASSMAANSIDIDRDAIVLSMDASIWADEIIRYSQDRMLVDERIKNITTISALTEYNRVQQLLNELTENGGEKSYDK